MAASSMLRQPLLPCIWIALSRLFVCTVGRVESVDAELNEQSSDGTCSGRLPLLVLPLALARVLFDGEIALLLLLVSTIRSRPFCLAMVERGLEWNGMK